MAADPNETTEIKASCLCGSLSASAHVPTDSLPIESYLCACTTCRHISGHLALSAMYIRRPLAITGPYTEYIYPAGPGNFSRCFCPTCGTSVFEDGKKSALHTSLATGALEKAEGWVDFKGCIFVGDTRDGGVSAWLPGLPAWEGTQEETSRYEGPMTKGVEGERGEEGGKLECYCRCGGVEFYITRPNEESRELYSPYGDAVVAHTTGGEEWRNEEDAKWWLCAGGTKYAASNCACVSCRKSSGYDIQQWAFVPEVNLFQKDGKPVDFSMGTLKEYKSSEGVTRHFCGKCGATVFWRTTKRPKLVDVSVGLMEAPSGSRAEEWLEWKTDRVSFTEFSQNRKLIGMLEEGLKEYQTTKTA